uniref:Putative secreted peptide n=1 Tax=Anopheles braziliensis TaxID=58242 RepID=A0A2M3ZUQ3_9DIPT
MMGWVGVMVVISVPFTEGSTVPRMVWYHVSSTTGTLRVIFTIRLGVIFLVIVAKVSTSGNNSPVLVVGSLVLFGNCSACSRI